jgi:hypothetical protein
MGSVEIRPMGARREFEWVLSSRKGLRRRWESLPRNLHTKDT